MYIRKMLFCIVMPACSSFLAGAWFTLNGVTNRGITILLAIIAGCAGWGYYLAGSILAYNIAGWLLELFSGFLYIKILAGLLGEFGVLQYLFTLALFVIMVIYTIKHYKTIKILAKIRKRVKRNEDSDDTPEEQQQE